MDVQADMFPATVTWAGRRLTPRRVWLVDGGVVIWRQSGRTVQAEYVLQAEVQTTDRKRWLLTVEDEPMTVTRRGGCGCGNPLKKIRPKTHSQLVAL